MILVAGLGNPGERYADTRHNLGFSVVEALAREAGVEGLLRPRFSGRFALTTLYGTRAGLLMPETYMNESGRSVQPALSFYKLSPEDLLVIHDELDLPFGVIRLKKGGGEAGHKGLKSISQKLGSGDYFRLRLGIGKDFQGDATNFVLQAVPPEQRDQLEEIVKRAVEAVRLLIESGPEAAMNQTNRREKR